MNENIKTFSLVVITLCVFIMTVIDILSMMQDRKERLAAHAASHQVPNNNSPATVDLPSEQIASPAIDQPITSIRFEEMKHDFGDIMKGDVVSYSFKFTNTGSNPLIISNAHGSCGCTIPSYPKEPIPPGGKATIEVQFDSAGREGLQSKNISVTANTNPPQTVLTITSNVNKK